MKAVIFDFDGTLTEKDGNIWRKIWMELGFGTDKNSLYAELYNAFADGCLSHKEWCRLTCVAFQSGSLKSELVDKIAEDVKLKKGVSKLLKLLKNEGCSLHIVSGNIKQVIKKVLGKNEKYFDDIVANEFVFDDDGYLTSINGTQYDFDGKANYVKEFSERTGIPTNEIYFVGNGWNDECVHKTGCHTICITESSKADFDNKEKWHINVKNIYELYKYFNTEKSNSHTEKELGK